MGNSYPNEKFQTTNTNRETKHDEIFRERKQLSYLSLLFIKHYLNYGALTWGRAAKTHVKKIDRSLKKKARLGWTKIECILQSLYLSISKYSFKQN